MLIELEAWLRTAPPGIKGAKNRNLVLSCNRLGRSRRIGIVVQNPYGFGLDSVANLDIEGFGSFVIIPSGIIPLEIRVSVPSYSIHIKNIETLDALDRPDGE
jgi:hypothetical protein